MSTSRQPTYLSKRNKTHGLISKKRVYGSKSESTFPTFKSLNNTPSKQSSTPVKSPSSFEDSSSPGRDVPFQSPIRAQSEDHSQSLGGSPVPNKFKSDSRRPNTSSSSPNIGSSKRQQIEKRTDFGGRSSSREQNEPALRSRRNDDIVNLLKRRNHKDSNSTGHKNKSHITSSFDSHDNEDFETRLKRLSSESVIGESLLTEQTLPRRNKVNDAKKIRLPIPSYPSKDKTKLRKADFEHEEWDSIRRGQMVSMKAKKILEDTRTEEDDSFLEGIKGNSVWDSKISSKAIIDDIDLDASININFGNDFEELNEKTNTVKQRKIVEQKYSGIKYPGSLSLSELNQKVKEHWDCVTLILNGKVGSSFYARAAKTAKSSKSVVLSNTEFLKLPISEYSIGFYGMKRQSHIASLIKKKFKSELNHSLLTNKTVQFWTVDSFTLYVLACEVALRIASEDLDKTEDEIFDIFQNTFDYGKYITDEISI